MEYLINERKFTYSTEGPRTFGPNEVLLASAIDLTKGMPWHEKGYHLENLLSQNDLKMLRKNTYTLLVRCWKEAGMHIPEDFLLENYHTLCTDFEMHLRLIDKTKLLPTKDFPIDISILEKQVSAVLQKEVHAHNPLDDLEVFHFRIIRPLSGDNNPLHRDIWLEDYDDCINLYIPIAGSNEYSSLILAPGSHLWPESIVERTTGGALINGKKYNVPAVTSIRGPAEFIRPNPTPDQVLIFSPYLIHGGAANLNTDSTRISIELRLWTKN